MKQLEKIYSKTERIVAKVRFSYLSVLTEVLLALILGGAITAVWIFAEPVETFFTKAATVQYLTEENLKWAILAAAILVLFFMTCRVIRISRKELIVTESKVVSKSGVFAVKSFILPVEEIKIIESHQNFLQRLLGYGTVIIITAAENPYKIKQVIKPEKLAQRILKQTTAASEKNPLRNISLQLQQRKK